MAKIEKQIALIFQEPKENHDKFYVMTRLQGDKTFVSKYGRMGSSGQQCMYPLERWDSLYREKIKKGYIDISNLPIKVGYPVKTQQNTLVLIRQIKYANNEPESLLGVDEHGKISWMYAKDVTPGYLKPGTLTHEAFYPNLLKEFKKVNGLS